MSLSADGGSDSDEPELRPAVNPFVAALLGAVLLSSDPAVSTAAQGLAQWMGGEPTTVVLTGAAVKEPGLKDLLGEVRHRSVLFIWTAQSMYRAVPS